ncbi:aldo/keto reductase [Dactylosporangium cerinum]
MRSDDITASAADTWTLGDRTVNRMGFGSMRITANPDRELAIRVLRRAVELGVNHIDTAAFYLSLAAPSTSEPARSVTRPI